MERKELCIISDSDIPSGSGGINSEGYTYGQLRHQPIITEILRRITHPIARQMAEDCNERNRKDTRVRDKKRLEKVGNLVKNSYLYR